MPNYCGNCGGTLDTDSKFCGKCGTTVGGAANPSAQTPAVVPAGIVSLAGSPSMNVPKPVWAGVIQVLWVITSGIAAIVYYFTYVVFVVAAQLGGFSGRGPFDGPGGAQAESWMWWIAALCVFSLVQFSFQIPIAIGFFKFKHWAYGLYMWTVVPFVLIPIILTLSRPSISELERMRPPTTISLISTTINVLWVVVVILQAVLVIRSKDEMAN